MKTALKTSNPLDSRQLNAFVTLSETGSVTETARRLSLTQSAISHSMRVLEEETGCRLLAKVGKSIVPTEAGEALLQHARLGLGEFAKGRAMLERLKQWGTRRFRVTAASPLDRQFLPFILARLRRQHPHLVVTMRKAHPALDADSIAAGDLDCAIAERPDDRPEVEFLPLFQTALQLVVPASHSWAKQPKIKMEDLARESWLLPESHLMTRKLIDRYFGRGNITLHSVAEVEDYEALKELVKAGMGVGILPAWITQQEEREKTLVALPMRHHAVRQSWGLLRRRDRPVDIIEAEFRSYWAATVAEEGLDQAGIFSGSIGESGAA